LYLCDFTGGIFQSFVRVSQKVMVSIYLGHQFPGPTQTFDPHSQAIMHRSTLERVGDRNTEKTNIFQATSNATAWLRMRHAIPTSLKSESHEPRKATAAVQTLCVSNELAAI
jgi:hypothetical protein